MSSRKKRQTRNGHHWQPSEATVKRQSASTQEREHFLGFYNALKFNDAQRYAEALTQRYPEDPFGWKVLGSCLHRNGHIEDSREALKRSLTLEERDAQTQHLMARVWYDLGEPTTALKHAQLAVELEPTFAQGHYTLAEILTEGDRNNEALTSAKAAESLGYDVLRCLHLRFQILIKQRSYREAMGLITELLAIAADNHVIQNEIANLYKDMAQHEEAEAAYRRALELRPDFDTAFSNLIIAMHYNPTNSAEHIFNTIREWNSHFIDQEPSYQHIVQTKAEKKRIRIGLVSGGFRLHPVGSMIAAGLEKSDSELELHLYSTNNADDPLTNRLKHTASSWNLVRHLSQNELAERIHQDGIDILFDLSGFGDGDRIRTMRRKPAPLIVKWVGGLINTMGMECYDYLLSDSYETPEGIDEWYVEKLIRMPDDYICYLPAPDTPSVTALPAITNGYITLGCFNNPAKINETLLVEWAKLMHELPNSRLLLKSGQYESAEYCDRIRRIMDKKGIEATRLILEGPSLHRGLLAAYNRVDIALDTWPYSGGLTTCEAFMMGVPVVTMPGPTFAGRHSTTHLINAGMPELVTFTWDEYRQKVVELAADIPNLSVIRACLRRFLMQSPVCDAEKFGRNFSRAMRAIWQRHCEGKAPAALTLNQRGQAFFEDSPEPVAIKKPKPALEQNGFRWDFEGKIIAVDNGGQLLDNPTVKSLVDQDLLEIIVFDPAGSAADNSMSQYEGIHYFAHNGLGDGKPGTLNICSDPAMTSLLEPLSDEQSGNGNTTNEVVSREPFNTVTLNSLDGLPSLDWLVLDDLSDSAAILDNGGEALKDTLLIQIKVAFQPTHERQPNLAEVQRWASRNGFRFYRLHGARHRSALLAGHKDGLTTHTELFAADALLLPDKKRLGALVPQQCHKLAFILHSLYELDDMCYRLLLQADESSAQKWRSQRRQPVEERHLSDPFTVKEAATAAPPPITLAGEDEESSPRRLARALRGRTLHILDTGHVANHSIVSSWHQRIFDRLNADNCPVRWLTADQATPRALLELVRSPDSVLACSNRYYDLAVNASGYGCRNIFQSYKHPVIGTINDHPYTNFMLERVQNASANGLYFARGSLAQELDFLRPDMLFIDDKKLESLPARHSGCERPHSERDIDVLVPMNLAYALHAAVLNQQLLATAESFGNDYLRLVEEVQKTFTDFSMSLLSLFRDAYQRVFQREWRISLPWSQEDRGLLQLLGQLDDVARGHARRTALVQLATLPSETRVVVLAPEETRRQLAPLIGAETLKNWEFIGTKPQEELQGIMTYARYVLNVFPTYHDWLHERVRDASVAGCALLTNSNQRATELLTDGESALFYDQKPMAQIYTQNPANSERIGFAGRRQLEAALISDDEAIEQTIATYADYLLRFDRPAEADSHIATPILPTAPHMSTAERALFSAALDRADHYFEFGAGGSTVWAIKRGLNVKGVESNAQWVSALRERLGEKCQLTHIDIGPTGAWGYPVSGARADRFASYSQSILDCEQTFDLILVDGRFRVACVMASIQHILSRTNAPPSARIFIHDFWNRPHYQVVLDFLEPVDSAESAVLLKLKSGIDVEAVKTVHARYAQVAD